MTTKHESIVPENDGNARKRVCKACNRCRLKKSKCDGASPCGRCKSDDVVCTFGERKRVLDKVHPKGYVELLEQQQAQLVAGIRSMWEEVPSDHRWKTEALPNESNGKIFVHDVLDRIGALQASQDYTPDQTFLDDPEQMQESLTSQQSYQHPLPTPPSESPFQHSAASSRPGSQQYTAKSTLSSIFTTPDSPLESTSPTLTSDSSALPTPTSPTTNDLSQEMSWLPTSTPCFSADDNWLSGPMLFNPTTQLYQPGSPLKPHAFLTGEVDALLGSFDNTLF